MRQRLATVFLVLISITLGTSNSPAQEDKPAPSTPVFYQQVEVNILNVDVSVADGKGNPIYGLSKDDFKILVDGEPVAIDNFYASEPAMAGQTSPQTESAASAEAPGEAQPAPVPEDQRLHLAVVVDTQRLLPAERNRVLKDLAAELRKGLRADDQILIATYNGGMRIRQPFTSNWRDVVANLDSLTKETSGGMGLGQDQRNILRELANSTAASGGGSIRGGLDTSQDEAEQILNSIRIYARQSVLQVQQTVAALNSLVDSLGGIRGRKALLYVTTGLEEHPGRAMLNAWDNKYSQYARALGVTSTDLSTGDETTTSQFKNLIDHANAKRVTFYSIGTAGAGVTSAIAADQGGGYEAGSGAGIWNSGLDAQYRSDMGASLAMIASDTGGRAMVNSSNYDELVHWVREDATSYYSLGIRAPQHASKKPGASHRIKVEVDRPGAVVRYRTEAVIRTAKEKAADQTLAELLYGTGGNPMAIAADFGPAQPHEKKDQFIQPILVKIPFVKLTLLPKARFHEGKVTIFVVAQDGDGRVSPVQSLEAPIRIPNDKLLAALKGVGGYRVGLVIRPGVHQIAIGVRDDVGDVTSTIRLQHDVEAPQKSS